MMSPTSENVREIFERLMQINWQPNPNHLRSNVALMREYLRRSALWAQVLGHTDKWPFDDWARYVDLEKRPSVDLVERLEKQLSVAPINRLIQDTCHWMLNWSALHRDNLHDFADLPTPFAPLLYFYERGGHFYSEHGYVYIEHVGVQTTLRGWQAYVRQEPYAVLDEIILDRLDTY